MGEPSWLSDLMAGSLLEDVPAAAFKAVLHHLDLQDHISLRLINQSVCKRATQQMSCISMRLTEASSDEQLSQWHQATRQLQHVTSIHVHVAGKVTAEVFDSAMQLVSQSFNKVSELHLLGEDAVRYSWGLDAYTASIPTLQPLSHLIGNLEILVVAGIAIANIAHDLENLAASEATGGRQLRRLSLQWSYPEDTLWFEFQKAMQQLPRTFPELQQLQVWYPQLVIKPLEAVDADAVADQLCGETGRPWSPPGDEHLVRSAMIAAVANAVMPMECLESMSIAYAPDMWESSMWVPPLGPYEPADAAGTAVVDATLDGGTLNSASAAVAAFPTLDHTGCWLLQHHGSLRELHISTETSCSISWRRPLQHLLLSSDHSQCSNLPGCGVASATEQAAAEVVDAAIGHDALFTEWPRWIKSPWPLYSFRPDYLMQHVSRCQLRLRQTMNYGRWDRDVATLLGPWIDMKGLKHLEVRLHQYQSSSERHPSTTPAAAEIVSAAATIRDLRSLTIGIDTWTRTTEQGLLAADELLLPLIAAAGGPGRSLQQLTLWGRCVTGVVPPTGSGHSQVQENSQDQKWQLLRRHNGRTHSLIYCGVEGAQDSEDTEREWRSCDPQVSDTVSSVVEGNDEDECELPAGDTITMIKKQQQNVDRARHLQATLLLTAAAVCPGMGWHHALQYLSCLREININHLGDELLDLPVQHLPASLKVLKGNKLHLFKNNVSEGPEASMIAAVRCAVCSLQTLVVDGNGADGSNAGSAPAGLRLQVLCLSKCSLSSPDILASSQLQQLTVIDSSWSGGWTAAAAAWPNLRQLVWKYDADVLGSNSSSSSNPDSSANLFNEEVVQHVTGGFRQLRKFIVQKPPNLPAAAVLQSFPFAVHVRDQYPELFEDRVL